jgi:type I restriction enzyme S subunit
VSGLRVPRFHNLNVADVRVHKLPKLPSLVEQRGIAATLGALDDKIESNRRLRSMLEREVALYFADLFDLSHSAVWIPISKLIDVNPVRRLSESADSPYIGMSVLPVDQALIEMVQRKPAGSGQRFMNGDVLMARITPCLENGKTAVVDVLSEGEVGWGSTEFVVLAPKPPLSAPWVYCLARSVEVRGFAIRNISGTSGRQRFPASAFGKYLIREPKADAVQRFNLLAETSFAKMGQLRDESRVLAELRDALLPELMSGRIRVPEAREAVEDAIG